MALDPAYRLAAEILGNPNIQRVIRIRQKYNPVWGWGAGADYLYRELVRAHGLEDHEDFLMRQAKPKRGRKREDDLAVRILRLKQMGFSVPKIAITLELLDNIYMSEEAVAAYLKNRRRVPD